jgi:hypothetical protein
MAKILAPMECEVFQIDCFVANSCGGIQCDKSRAHGGKPLPWKMLLSTNKMAKATIKIWGALPIEIPRMYGIKPNERLAKAQSARPIDM